MPGVVSRFASTSRVLALLVLVGAASSWAQDERTPTPATEPAAELPDPHESVNPQARPEADASGFVEITPELVRAVDLGLAFLAQQQNPVDGAIGHRDYRVAVTALAGLAFMAGGSTIESGPYAQNVRKAVEFFLDLRGSIKSDRWHIAVRDDKSRLHGHGYATLFLSQAYGTAGDWERRDELADGVREAVRLIVLAQERQGGWGYVPLDAMHEGSITVTQLQALRSARDAGLYVPRGTIVGALDYLEKSKSEHEDWVSFVYRLGDPQAPSFPLAAAAISSLNAVGNYRSATVEKGLNFMRRYIPGAETLAARQDERYEQFWFYGQLYAVQAMYQAGGSDWPLWFRAIRRELIDRQVVARGGRTGYWGQNDAEQIYGREYMTAIACIVLQVPYRLLPILQR